MKVPPSSTPSGSRITTVEPRCVAVDTSALKLGCPCTIRIEVGRQVKYVTIAPGIITLEQTMALPQNFKTTLPALPYEDPSWNMARLRSKSDGGREEACSRGKGADIQHFLFSIYLSHEELPGVTDVWHSGRVDIFELNLVKSLAPLTGEYSWPVSLRLPARSDTTRSDEATHPTVIAKIARFPSEIPLIEAETAAYQKLQGTGVTPRFLGHVYEDGRAVGIVIEKLRGRPAGIRDLRLCADALACLHKLGGVHGDCSIYNFVVGDAGSHPKAWIIDFERSRFGCTEEETAAEFMILEFALQEMPANVAAWRRGEEVLVSEFGQADEESS